MLSTAANKVTDALRNGLLALGLLALAGCQTTPEPRPSDSPGAQRSSAVPGPSLGNTRQLKPRNKPAQAASDAPYTLWARIREGFLLDPAVIDNPRIDQQRLAFASQPRYFEWSSDRSRRYLHYVVEQLDAREMPLELALLPFVESSYNPLAYSSAHAAGLWQFIPSTGQVYSLRQDWWYDGRRDVTASTQAALDYLTRLNELFDGDWLLALAAYNCGEGCVGRAIKRNESLGLPTDYWNLQLPRETMNYVPKLLALAQIIESPSLYGTSLPEILDEPYFAEVTVDTQIDLHKAAELAAISTEEFMHLNPAFKRRVTAPTGPYQLLVPVANAEQFSAALAELPAEERVDYRRYNVRRGDTLSQIAKRYQLSVDVIRDVNDIRGNTLQVGQTLMLPHSGEGIPEPVGLTAMAASGLTYRVQPGDNLWAIAQRHGVSVSILKQHNGLSSSAISVGQQLNMPGTNSATASPSSPAGRRVTYTVKSGDSLYSIARRHRVEVDNIRQWNRLGGTLRPGQQLILHVL
jgi:membrane-bound lytic murein transglycosylase D